jgi:alkyl hydroperoxide reductase subunit AhpF
MTPAEEAQIRSLNETLTREVTIGMRLTDDPRSRDIEGFCDRLVRLAPKIRMRREEAATASLPAILVGPRLSYCGIPSYNELAPFIEALAFLNAGKTDLPETIVGRLQHVRPPASVSLYVAPLCKFCPDVVRRLLPLPFAVDGLRMRIIDGVLFKDAAEEDRVRSVPTVILDNHYRWTGGVTLPQLCEAVENRDPTKLDKAALQRLVTESGAYDLARMMLNSGRVFEAFLELLIEENFTVRLAAMVTMEELTAANLTLARQVIAPLWKRYPRSVDSVKGDILYIFGELQSPQSLPYLRSVLAAEENPEIREAAQEALEKIESVLPRFQ